MILYTKMEAGCESCKLTIFVAKHGTNKNIFSEDCRTLLNNLVSSRHPSSSRIITITYREVKSSGNVIFVAQEMVLGTSSLLQWLELCLALD